MKKLSLLLTFCMMTLLGQSQEVITAWTFDDLEASPSTPKVIYSNDGWEEGVLYADGTNGSSDFNSQAPELNAFNGTTMNDPRDSQSASKDFALVGNSANGKSIVFKLSTSGYQNIQLTYAQRGSDKGFKKEEWWYSTDGVNFVFFDSISPANIITYTLRTVDFTSVTELNDAETVYFKMTVYGATTSAGNNRIDNVVFRGNLAGPDIYPPVITKFTVESPSVLKIVFNENVDPETAENTDNYTMDGYIFTSAALTERTVVLTPSLALAEGLSYTLYVSNVEDLEGNVMTPDTFNFTFGVDQQYHVGSIAELRAKWNGPTSTDSVYKDNTKYKLTGNVLVTAINQSYRNQVFIQDETGAIVIDDYDGLIETDLYVGDEITGLYGTLTNYYGLLQFVITDAFTSEQITLFNPIEPLVLTLDQLQDIEFMNNHQCELIRVENVTFTQTGTFENGKKYDLRQGQTTGTGVWMHIYNIPDLIGEAIPTAPVYITGVNKISYDKYYLIPRDAPDISTTGIEDIRFDDGVTLFPNPAVSTITVNSGNILFSKASIYDINGKFVLSTQVKSDNPEINVENLAPGQYFLKLSGKDKKTAVKKFVKE